MDDLLTVQEAAGYLRVSRTTVWRWCKEGKLPAFKVGRDWRVRRSEFEKLVGQKFDERDSEESGDNEE